MSSPTIKDVSKLAGVSISTVSRVMNDSKPVSPEARRKVLDAIQKLDFKPNELARSLVMKRSNLIGVVVKDIGIPYMTQIVRGVEEIGRMYKYDILLSSTYGDVEQEKRIIDFLFTKQVEGVILISEDVDSDVMYKLRNQTIPFVELDKYSTVDDINTVRIDYTNAMEELMEYVHQEQGHERILFVKKSYKYRISNLLSEGYTNYCDEHHLKKYTLEVFGRKAIGDGYDIAEEVFRMKEHFGITCVIFSEDEEAVGFINYCYDHNKKVPDDISVAGFGDIPITSIYRPTITTVQEPYYDIGAVSMRRLVKVLKDKKKIENVTVLPSQVMKRESVKKIR